jgi:DNA-binding SARP family transcriptional activator
MPAQRPLLGSHLLDRPRLRRRLPDSEGWVVVLEAPYGYGKSVLAAQWAADLEREGWAVRWTPASGRSVREAFAVELGLPLATSWADLLPALWAERAAWVVEDLAADDDLGPLLDDVPGLLALLCRTAPPAAELPRLGTQGRLLRLTAAELAFTADEADAIFHAAGPAGGRAADAARRAWAVSGGWPLPLHFAAIGAGTADPATLLDGVRASLSDAAWREALLLSALPYLPREAEIPATAALVAAGFTQEVAEGHRLHAFVAEAIVGREREAVQRAVRAAAARLPPTLAAEAYGRAGLPDDLRALLEGDPVPGRLGSLDPTGFLRWDAAAGGEPGPSRLLSRAWALSVAGRGPDAVAVLDRVEAHPDAGDAHVLAALGWRAFELDAADEAGIRALMERAALRLGRVAPRAAASFLANVSVFHYKRHDWAAIEALQTRALELLEGVPDAEGHRSVLVQRLAEVRWERTGDLLGYVAANEAQERAQRDVSPYNALVARHELGVMRALVGDPAAGADLAAAEAGLAHNAIVATCAAAERAALEGRPEALPALVARFRPWRRSFPDLAERIDVAWARALRRSGAAVQALEALGAAPGVARDAERALALAAAGRHDEARAVLPPAGAGTARRVRLEVAAARFRVLRDPVELDAAAAMTLAGVAVLPALVPLDELPRERPELADPYPIRDVLRSRWAAAIARRIDEVPGLEVALLGRLGVRLLGEEVALTTKHREMLALLALGHDRDAVAEALWPEAERRKQQNNLHVQTTLLRRALEPWGVSTYLDAGGLVRADVDVDRLRAAVAAGDAAACAALYREPLAPGLDLPLLDEARDELRAQVVAVWKGAVAGAASSDTAAIALLERVLAVDPLDEGALADLLRRLVRAGRRHEAKRRYDAFADLVERELGLTPLATTTAALGMA